MAKCDLCGKDAGLLRQRHKECEAKRDAALVQVTSIARDAALAKLEPGAVRRRVTRIASESFIPESQLRSLYVTAFEQAVDQILEDGIVSKEEEAHLASYKEEMSLTQDDLDRSGAFMRVAKASIIREVLEGKLPDRVEIEGELPFNFQKGEKLVWVFQGVQYGERRVTTRYRGSYQGVSLRVVRGLYYRTGGFRGNPIPVTTSVTVDTGLLGVTNKHLYFAGPVKSFRIAYGKIVSIQPYTDGIGIQRDAASARPQLFITGDGWFTYNLVSNLARAGTAQC